MDKATQVFTKFAKDVSAKDAVKIIKSRHSNTSTSKVTNPKHKNKVIANVIGTYKQNPKNKLNYSAITNAIKNNQVQAHADTSRHGDGTIKSIKHTIAYPNRKGTITVNSNKRSWNTKVTNNSSSKTTGASMSEAKKATTKVLNTKKGYLYG